MFNKFKSQSDSSVEKATDRVGGFQPLASGLYKEALIKMVYFTQSEKGATFANVKLDIDGKDFNERLLISNKDGENFWTKDGKTHLFDGFLHLDAMCLFITGQPFEDNIPEIEEKMVNVWNSEKRAEVPTEVNVLTPVLNERIDVLIAHRRTNKQEAKDGTYVNTAQAREYNEIIKFVSEDRLTVLEITEEIEEPIFVPQWLERWEGKLIDSYKEVKDSGKAGRPSSAKASNAKGRSSGMFAKKR